MTNAQLKNTAIEAIRNYHADQSVSIETTRDGLEDIISEAQQLVDACNADLGPDGQE